MLCRQVLVVFLASARAWKCPQVECTGWSEAYNNVINGVYLANEATDTAPRWTYTKADAAIHLRFSEFHGNAWLVTDSVTAALAQVQTYAYVRPAPTSYPEDANVTAADGGAWFVWSGTAHVSSGFTCACLLGPPSLPPSPPPPPPMPPPPSPPPLAPPPDNVPLYPPPAQPPPPVAPMPRPPPSAPPPGVPSPCPPPPPPSPSPPPPLPPPSPASPSVCGGDPAGECDAVCQSAFAGGAATCECGDMTTATDGVECAPARIDLGVGGTGTMVTPIVLRGLFLAAGGSLTLALPLHLAAASAAVFTLYEAQEGGGLSVAAWSVRGPIASAAASAATATEAASGEQGSGGLRALSEAAAAPAPPLPPPYAPSGVLDPLTGETTWAGPAGGEEDGTLELECGYDLESKQLAKGTYLLTLTAGSNDVEFTLNLRKRTDMGISKAAASTLATAVTTAVVTTVAAGVGSTVAASVSASMGGAAAGAGGGAGGASSSASSGAGSGGAIVLLGQVQSMALTAQYNVDMPEAYTEFSTGFKWANMQIDVTGGWEPPTAVQGNTTALANATSVAARRRLHREHRRRLDDESSQSEECFSISTEPSEDANATQANATAESEVARDGTTSYLASLGTSAERFFMNNLITMALAFLGLVLLHLLVLWLLKRRALRKGRKWTGAPVALAFPAWELTLVIVAFQGVCQSCFVTMRTSGCSVTFFSAALLVLLCIPTLFLVWMVWFVVRQIYSRKVITFEEFGQEGKKEATASLKESLCRRKGQSVCTWFAALSIAWADFTLAVWNVGEWKGNPRFLGMYGVLFESFDGSHFFYMGFELGKKLVLAFFLVVPPSWGNVQLYGASAMQVLAVLTMVLRRPHSAYTDNLKDAVVQGSQALGSLAFLAGSLQLWQIPMPDIALFVMYSQIASVLYIVLVQVGDILKVLVQAFVSVGQAVVRASLAVASAVDAMRLARALQVDGAAAAHAVKIARAIKAVMANSVLIELEGEKLLTLAERTFRPAIDEQLKTALEGAGATRLAELLEGELAEAAEEVDTKYKSLAQIAGKSGKKGRRAAKQATAKGYGPAPSAAEAAPAAKAGRGGKKKTARVAPSPEKQPSLGRVRVEPPPSPPASPPAEYEQELASLANAKPEAVAEPPAPLRRRSSSGSARDLVRSLSKSSSFARLNGYDAEETYAPTVVMTPEVEAVVEAAEGGRPVQSAAEAAHTAAQGELVREEVAAQLQLPHGMRELLNAPHAEAAETMVEARWLATAGWRDRAELVAQRASSLAERAHGKDGGGATGEALLQGVLPSYAAVERAAIKETMVEVHEEDNEYAGGAKFLGSREEMREALARITLQKVEDATREASMRALERQMGGTVAAQSVQHVVVNAMMRKLQPRMQKLCDVKTAALLHYAAAAYLRLAEAAVPKQTSAGI